MSTQCAPTIEVPTGYALVERLGAGGYGEVWKATAPGGVEKAIKIVFGHCDEELAEREGKSLDRIRSVRHPFLLSIERYEVVNHRLVIVTELADRSLDMRFKECRQAGLPGIPRDELVGYLADAAEALDWLGERYSLQHLDVKPENLLLVGEHIKVADFGLVKDIASQTLNSMVGGMTPMYSPPELYDDEPSPHSDQYSLAIVYQQMLTGEPPFSGRTSAQLAKQHMQSPPVLTPLSELDRQVVGRALAKNPSERFHSSRDFVAALRGAPIGGERNAAPATAPRPAPDDDTQSTARLNTTPLNERPQAAPAPLPAAAKSSGRRYAPFPAVTAEVVDQPPPEVDLSSVPAPAPTLLIGMGGVGVTQLCRCGERFAQAEPTTPVAWLAIDTEIDAIKGAARGKEPTAIDREDLVHTPLRRPRDYRDASPGLLKWLSRRWLYNIPRSLQTRGFRPLGRLALVDHAERVLEALHARLQRLAKQQPTRADGPSGIDVVVLAGASGGTGSGGAIDIAQAARSLAEELGVTVRVRGVFSSTFRKEAPDSLGAANMYALLEELDHAQRRGNRGDASPQGAASFYERDDPPFDELRLVHLPPRNDAAARELALQCVADLALLEATSGIVEAASRPFRSESPPRDFACLQCVDLTALRNSQEQEQNGQRVRGFARYCLKAENGVLDPAADGFGRYAQSRLSRRIVSLITGPAEGEADAAAKARRRAERLELAAPVFQALEECLRDGDDGVSQISDTLAPVYSELLEALGEGVAQEENARGFFEDFARSRLPAACSQDGGVNREVGAKVLEAVKQVAEMEPPLACGHDRVTYTLSGDATTGSDNDALANQLPHARPLHAPGVAPQVLMLGGGIRPLHLGARLAESFPDIEEAASRLHARDDIEWLGLRPAVAPA